MGKRWIKIISFCVSSLLAILLFKQPILAAGGTGSADDPFIIETAEELRALSGTALGNNHYKLGADIDVSGSDWVPIKSLGTGGSFDGDGHTVSGITINGKGDTSSSTYYHGLFALNYGTIMNMNISGTVSDSSGKSHHTGILVGHNTASGVVKNITCEANIVYTRGGGNGVMSLGGIVGYNLGLIDSCSTSGNIQKDKGNGTQYYYYVGGIAGIHKGGVIRNCFNTATIYNNGSATGGIAGENNVLGMGGASNVTIENCYNLGRVEGRFELGGIAGRGTGSSFTNNVYNAGYVHATVTSGSNMGNITSNIASGKYNETVYGVVGGDDNSPASLKLYATNGNGTGVFKGSYVQNNEESLQEMCDQLNAWIDSQPDPSIYKRWYYGDGRPYPTFDPILSVTFKAGNHGNFGLDGDDNPITEVVYPVQPNDPWDDSWVPTTIEPDEGYEFDGWDPDEFPDEVTEPLVFTAKWKAIEYNITYDNARGNDPATANPDKYTVEDSVSISNDPTRDGYTFTGWTSDDMSTPITDPTKPVTWSAGDETGDKTFTANWEANTDTPYKVEFYYQGDDGTYPDTATYSDDRSGETDTQVSVTADDKIPAENGYVFDENNTDNVLEGNIEGDGSLVLKLYFKKQFTVKYAPGEHGTWTTEEHPNLDYNAATPAFEGDTTNCDEGYEFDKWSPDIEATVTENKVYTAIWKLKEYSITYDLADGDEPTNPNPETYTIEDEVTISNEPTRDGYNFLGWTGEETTDPTKTVEFGPGVTGDRTYTANWEARDDTKYTVEYYYQENGSYPTSATDSDERTGTTDTTANVTDNDKEPSKDGYIFDADGPNVLSGNIEGDGSLVLKVYFKQQFTVKYAPGDHGTWNVDDYTTSGLDYNATTPAFTGDTDTEHDEGYTFGGWTPSFSDTVTTDVEYVAQWTADEDTPYTVEYYYQVNGEYPSDPDSSVQRSGTTDTTANVTDTDKEPSKDGYIFDADGPNVLSGNIEGDGSLVLKVCFKQQFTVKYAPGDHGTWNVDDYTTSGLDYNATTPAFTGDTDTEHDEGYTFVGWNQEVAGSVTEDVTYTAQWELLKFTITWLNDDESVLRVDENVEYGTTPSYGSTPTKEPTAQYTYTFDKWNPDVVPATADATYTASYKAEENTYTIIWKNDDGTVLETDEVVPYGETPTYDGSTPTKEPTAQYTYEFDGWEPDIEPVTGPQEYKAKFKQTVREYELTFDFNGGNVNGDTGPRKMKYAYGTAITIMEAPTRDGYKFLYWKGSQYQPGDSYTVVDDHVFTAVWEKVSPQPPVPTPPTPIKPTPKPKGRTCQDDGYPAGYYWNGTACVKAGVPVPNTGDSTDLGLWFFVLSIALGSIYLAQRKIKKI